MHGLCEHDPRIAGVLAIMWHPSPPCPRPPQSGVGDKLCIFNRQPGSETRLQLKTGIDLLSVLVCVLRAELTMDGRGATLTIKM